jgi:hypothetical protein
MRKRGDGGGPSVEGFTLASVLDAFAALGEALEVAAEVRKGKERLALEMKRPHSASRHAGASEAYRHAASQLLDLVADLEEQASPWERSSIDGEVGMPTSGRPPRYR